MNKEYGYATEINTRHPFEAFLTFPAVEALQREDMIYPPLPGGMETWDRIEEWTRALDQDRVRHT
jgi:hypothetical protein